MVRSIVLTVSATVACNVYDSTLLDDARGAGGSPDEAAGTAGALSGSSGDASGGVSGTNSSSSGGVQPESGAAGEEPGGGVPGGGSDAVGGTDSIGGTSTGGSNGGATGGGAGANAGGSGSGMGGASGAGGSGGSAGSGGSGIVEVLIDDLEDGDHQIALMGQLGYWYAYHDTTAGTQVPDPTEPFAPVAPSPSIPGNASSLLAVHVTWQGFTGWGAGVGATFTDTDVFYDASAHTGVSFWARIEGSSTTRVDVILQERRAIAPNCTSCGHHPFRRIDLSTEWQKLYLPFPSFQSDGNGNPSFFDLDPSGLYGIQFFTGPNRNVDIWIDDLAFYSTNP